MMLAAIGLGPGAFAQDAIYAPGIPAPASQIPILTSTDPASGSTDHFSVTVSPLTTQRTPDASGVLADSANENVDFGWHLPLYGLFTLGYDTDVNSFRQDQEIWDDEEATSQITSSLANKISVQAQPVSPLKITPYVQEQRSLTDGQPGFSDATKYGADTSWAPVKNVTTLTVGASTQQTYNFDHSILDENLYTSGLDQKLPYVPVTLHTAGSITDDASPTLLTDDKDNKILNASLLWKVIASTSLSGGIQDQGTTLLDTDALQDTKTYFTQVALQASRSWTVTVRGAHDLKSSTQSGQFLSNGSDDTLSLGLTWNLGDRFNAGAGINYRVEQSQTPAPALNTPPASVSLSAGGNF